jgi:hypothetical protein
MLAKIRRHLTYANVMSTLAAFLILGGGTALASFIITKNSQVGPGTIAGHHPPARDHANIISGSVNGTDLSSGAVTGAKIAASSVSSGQIVDGQVRKPDLAAPEAWHNVPPATIASDTAFCTTNPLGFACRPPTNPIARSAWRNDDFGFNNVAAYYKDPQGEVHLKGIVCTSFYEPGEGERGCDTVSPVSTRELILTLPAGYRPAKEWSFHTATAFGDATVVIAANGEVSALSGDRQGLSLDGIDFRACGEPGAESCS